MSPRLGTRLTGLPLPFRGPQFVVPIVPQRPFGTQPLSPLKPNRYKPKLESTPEAALERKLKSNSIRPRTGVITIKKGMTALYDPITGVRQPGTILQLDRVQVVSHKTVEKNGYYAVQLGSGWRSPRNISKGLLGHVSANGVSPKRHIFEFRVRDQTGLLPIGQLINADWFREGDYVDARSKSKGKGFQGVMKRWGFAGQDRTHGASLSHRSLGNTAPGQGGGSRVYPGKKMPGNMGNRQNTVQNLKVLKVDAENGIVVVQGMSPLSRSDGD